MRRLVALGLALAGVLVAAPANADVTLVEGDDGSFTLGGYLRTLSGVQHYGRLGLPDALLPEPMVGQNVGVGRLEWTGAIGDRLTLDLHQRVLWRVESRSTLALAGGSGFGVGVSTPPERNVDLSTALIDEEGIFAEHDIDRLSARIYLERADVYLGRQAISWGNSLLFSVSDIWTRFSPYELDTSERRGVDAVRVITGPTPDSELEFVVADRGPVEDLSGGARATFYRPRGDIYVAVAKTWQEAVFSGGFARDLSTVTLRGEALLPLDWENADVDGVELGLPRATLGVDHFRDDWAIMAEYHFNGAGENEASDYGLNALSSPAYERGEVYLLGRHYVGANVSWNPTELTTLGLGTVLNLLDPSALLTPTFSWQLAQDVDLSFGGFVPLGATPEIGALLPQIRSEFGSAPTFVYGQIAAYY